MQDRVQLCNELGCVALEKGDHKEARKHFRYMVKEARKQGLREQARAFDNLAGLLEQEREYEAAEKLLRTAMQIKMDARGDSFPGIFQTALQLSNLLQLQGRPDESKEVLDSILPGVKRFAATVKDSELNGLLGLLDGGLSTADN